MGNSLKAIRPGWPLAYFNDDGSPRPADWPRPGAALDNIRIVAPRPSDPRALICKSEFSRLFEAVSIKTGGCYEINCRSHRCPRHKAQWGKKWASTIGEQLSTAQQNTILLVNLTTAARTSHRQIKEALELFIARFRRRFGRVEYVRVAEMNKKHTQSHYHCIFVFKEAKIPPMPPDFEKTNIERRKNKQQELSWPPQHFEFIRDTWADCLSRKASGLPETKIVWCQPPKSEKAAAKYAVGYITGQSGRPDKNEDLDESYTGRKICYSKQFFTTTAADLWAQLLEKWFGPRDPDDLFFWQGRLDNDAEAGDNPEKFRRLAIMIERYAIARHYRETGTYPAQGADPGPPRPGFIWEIIGNQEAFIPTDPLVAN